MNVFLKAMLRANVLDNIVNLIHHHEHLFYSTRRDESGNIVPGDAEDAYRMEVVDEVIKALEKLL